MNAETTQTLENLFLYIYPEPRKISDIEKILNKTIFLPLTCIFENVKQSDQYNCAILRHVLPAISSIF